MKQPVRVALYALAVTLFATSVYRAATQSLVHDEALNWQFYLHGPFASIFTFYDANHHFLATLLARVSVGLFGDSAFAIRLPALLAGAWYLWSALRLSEFLFGSRPYALLLTVLLAANPFVMDFMVAARGYGLALACLLWALLEILRALAEPPDLKRPPMPPRGLARAGAALALSVTANLTFLIPASVLGAAVVWLLSQRTAPTPVPKKGRGKAARQQARREWPWFLGPAATVAVLFVVSAPLENAAQSNFYAGEASLTASLYSLAEVSFAHNTGTGGIFSNAPLLTAWVRILSFAIPVLVAVALVFSLKHGSGSLAMAMRLASLTVLGSWAALIGAHFTIGLLYPLDRTGIYMLPLSCVALVALAAASGRAGQLLAGLLVIMAVEFVLQWSTSSFFVWRYDADTPRILSRIEELHQGPTRLGISWELEPSFNYYRLRRHLDWMPPLGRRGPDGDYDLYVLTARDQPLIAARHLRVLYQGRVSGTVVAAPAK